MNLVIIFLKADILVLKNVELISPELRGCFVNHKLLLPLN